MFWLDSEKTVGKKKFGRKFQLLEVKRDEKSQKAWQI